ncbi:hypothetical protein CEXT_811651 [Caerostris extrusa]|uniref:Uncharacterized protein n=1 Tax=Caerostris extrusa TaxID=172846 RepID=A0AAV4WU03_CAEEX|nr:hypothetical protein CEXT_811651 [Caerostris extrusa]
MQRDFSSDIKFRQFQHSEWNGKLQKHFSLLSLRCRPCCVLTAVGRITSLRAMKRGEGGAERGVKDRYTNNKTALRFPVTLRICLPWTVKNMVRKQSSAFLLEWTNLIHYVSHVAKV